MCWNYAMSDGLIDYNHSQFEPSTSCCRRLMISCSSESPWPLWEKERHLRPLLDCIWMFNLQKFSNLICTNSALWQTSIWAFCTLIWLKTREPSSPHTAFSSSLLRENSWAPFRIPRHSTTLEREDNSRSYGVISWGIKFYLIVRDKLLHIVWKYPGANSLNRCTTFLVQFPGTKWADVLYWCDI